MTDEQDEKTMVNLKLSIDVDEHLTWAELFRFVELARGNVSPDSRVGIDWDDDTRGPGALYVYLDQSDIAAATPPGS